ncbi:TonB-dependent receptor family protein [Flavobacterium gyeonganense]|uniref:TonB-dependent receptor family protein n=1 Tax=Flavobacterium gyeonganense TaxID=1310418 RepID=A0ABV5H9W5_9FLAO|nr:TonB-dependent receptor [Flavobacterium gyeonganense]
MKSFLFITGILANVTVAFGQTANDTVKTHHLAPVTIEGNKTAQDIQRLEPIQGTYIFSGRKTEVIDMTQKNAAITEKYGRQIFAKIPGVFVYDMDGTGNQLNISTRGLDPHRSWEFNIRKDGIITNSDMYGYPASHYNIPMEGVDRIELVRGTGSLQYGAQFGGMLNYVSKQPDTIKKITFETINTLGSYGLVSTYNSISGKIGKFRYSAWINGKWITGYRENSDSSFDAQGVSLFYDATKDISFKLEWTHSNYITHIPGPLTDNMFMDNPKMSTRSRNYYQPNIHVPSLTADWNIASSTKLRFTTSAVLGERNSVMFDKPANVTDEIVPATLEYNNRQVDIDHFNSYTTELRVLQSYKFLNKTSSIAAGVQYMNNDLHRQQQGKGTTGTDFDLSLVSPGWGRDLHFKTSNIAFFVENRWLLTRRFSLNTGVRIENGETNMTGIINNYSDTELPNKIKHSFPLFGVSTQYDITGDINIYAGWSQAYRPVIFKDIIPQSVYEVSDKNLKDAYGYNTEFGFRGKYKFLKWDVTAFCVQYNNRMGTLAQTDTDDNLIIFRTNIGDSRTKGIEFFLQGDFSLGKKTSLSLFTSTSFMDARYQDATIRSGNSNVSIRGNKVESVPKWISRNGITVNYDLVSLSALYSYTYESFADALNTTVPSASGAVGLVPAYQLLDLNLAVRITEKIKFQFNINDVLDEHYFTKRPQFYPGPGIWPSDGRTFSGTLSIKI